MRINPGRLETDHFTVGRAAGATFCHFPSLSEPVGSKRSQIELKTQSPKFTCPNLSVWTAGSFVLTPAPIGTQHQLLRTCFSRLSRVRPGAETGRPVPKSILIGAPIPYAERPPARNHGEAAGETVTYRLGIALLLFSYLAQDTHTRSQPACGRLRPTSPRLGLARPPSELGDPKPEANDQVLGHR